MPVVAMFGIVYFTAVTTAAGRDELLKIGWLLVAAAVLHNGFGYVFGYGLARLTKLDVASARTVAFEVGLQNGGMASGIAGSLGKLGNHGIGLRSFQSMDECVGLRPGEFLASQVNTTQQRPMISSSATGVSCQQSSHASPDDARLSGAREAASFASRSLVCSRGGGLLNRWITSLQDRAPA